MDRRRAALYLVFLATLGVAAALFVNDVRTALAVLAARLCGYELAYDSLEIDGRGLSGSGIRVRPVRSAGPVFTAQAIAAAYDLRALLAGGPARGGLRLLSLERPHLFVERYRDGSYNLPVAAGNPAPPGAGAAAPPWWIHAAVRDGSISLRDDAAVYPQSRRIEMRNITVAGDLVPGTRPSRYGGTAVLLDGGVAYRVVLHGVIDRERGIEIHDVTAPLLSLGPLLDFGVNSGALDFERVPARDLHVRLAGIVDRNGAYHYHLGGGALLAGGRLGVHGLAKPVRDLSGPIELFDDGLSFRRLTGTLANAPLAMSGGVYGLRAPAVRIDARLAGDASALRTVLAFGARQPLRGSTDVETLIEGPVLSPVVLTNVRAPRLTFGAFPLDDTAGLVALNRSVADLVAFDTVYAGIALQSSGTVHLDSALETNLAARVTAPPGTLPYAGAFAPGVPLQAAGVATGTSGSLATHAQIFGAAAQTAVRGSIDVAAGGTGSIGPLVVDQRGRNTFYSRVAIDHPGNAVAAFIAADHLRVRGSAPVSLPGFSLVNLPILPGTFDGRLAAAVVRGQMLAGGEAATAASLRDALAAVPALAPFVAQHAVRGAVDARFAVVTDGKRSLLRIDSARFTDARIDGIPIDGLRGTAGARPNAFDVYGASARFAGGSAYMLGSFGNGGTLQITANALDLAGVPIAAAGSSAGRLSFVIRATGTLNDPRIQAGLVVAGARYRLLPASGNTSLSYAGHALSIHDAAFLLGQSAAFAHGGVAAAQGAAPPRYDMNIDIPAADLHSLLAAANMHAPPVEGSVTAGLRVRGAGRAPSVSGALAAEGNVNGLAFENGSVTIAVGANAFHASDGRVTFGTTALHFSGTGNGASIDASLRGNRVDLADFNDYFDNADTLGGTGHAAFSVTASSRSFATAGDILLEHFRYRAFELGAAAANWRTRGGSVLGSAGISGRAGRFFGSGSLELAARDPYSDPLRRSTIQLAAGVRALDLADWLPAAGLTVPVTGRVDADATASGRYPEIAMHAQAALEGGTVGRLSLSRAAVRIHTARRRAVIDAAVVDAPAFAGSAAGSLGFERGSPIALAVRIASPSLKLLSNAIGTRPAPIDGSMTSTATIGGSFARPIVHGDFDVANLAYARFSIPHVRGRLEVDRRHAALQNGRIDLSHGRLLLAGRFPFATGAVSGDPFALDISADHAGLASFQPLLPQGSKIGGTLDGRVVAGGTFRKPQMNGALSLAGGMFSGPFETAPISAMQGKLVFAGTRATLMDMRASVGSGSVVANGSVRVGDLTGRASKVGFGMTIHAHRAFVDLPAYYKGQIDGGLDLSRPFGSASTVVSGNLAFSDGTIPLSAIYNPKSAGGQAAKPLDVAFALDVAAQRAVSVVSGNVDISAQGHAHVGGTLAQPTLAGVFTANGGTLNFYRQFTLQRGRVHFSPGDGVVPDIDAAATTVVSESGGPIEVRLDVTGLATQLNVALSSDPAYDRTQILALLVNAQALGVAIPGVASGPPSGFSASALATTALDQQLTNQLLKPLSNGLGTALGLRNLALGIDPTSGFSATARRALGRDLYAIYGESFGYPTRQTFGVEADPNPATSLTMTIFDQQGQLPPGTNSSTTPQGLALVPGLVATTVGTGNNGFSVAYQRRFWGGKRAKHAADRTHTALR